MDSTYLRVWNQELNWMMETQSNDTYNVATCCLCISRVYIFNFWVKNWLKLHQTHPQQSSRIPVVFCQIRSLSLPFLQKTNNISQRTQSTKCVCCGSNKMEGNLTCVVQSLTDHMITARSHTTNGQNMMKYFVSIYQSI